MWVAAPLFLVEHSKIFGVGFCGRPRLFTVHQGMAFVQATWQLSLASACSGDTKLLCFIFGCILYDAATDVVVAVFHLLRAIDRLREELSTYGLR